MKRILSLALAATLAVLLYAQLPVGIIRSSFIGVPGAQSSSGLVLVEEHTASSSAELDFTTCISGTYDDYQVNLVNLLNATDAQPLYMQVSTDGGGTYSTSTYSWANNQALSSASAAVNGSTSDSGYILGAGQQSNTAAWGGLSGHFAFLNPGSASAYKMVTGQTFSLDSRDALGAIRNTGGTWATTTAVNAFRLKFGSGNIASGTARCYGYSK